MTAPTRPTLPFRRKPALGAVFASLADATTAWQAAMTALEAATVNVLTNVAGAIPAGQDAITSGTAAAAAVGSFTNGSPDPTLQARWTQDLQAFDAASANYNPLQAPGATPVTAASVFQSDGLHLGTLVLSWPVVIGGALLAWFLVPKLLKTRRAE